MLPVLPRRRPHPGAFLMPLLAVGAAIGIAVLAAPVVAPVGDVLLPLASGWCAWLYGPLSGGLATALAAVAQAIVHRALWPHGWTAQVIAPAVLTAAGAIVGTALRRARLEREQTRREARAHAARVQRQTDERRAAFLAHASRVLASSPDYQSTLRTVAELAVPQIADWCVIDMLQKDGSLKTMVARHVDPEKIDLVLELRRTYPIDLTARFGVAQVLRTGQSLVHPEVSDDILQTITRDGYQLKFVEALGMRSAIAVPLLIGGRRLGVLSLMTAESGRRYVAADLLFAEDLARRAAIALDTAADRAAHEHGSRPLAAGGNNILD